MILDTAPAVGAAFAAMGFPAPWELVANLVAHRREPGQFLVEQYQQFIASGEEQGLPGMGPLRGLVSAQEWQDLRDGLLADPGSMVDTLRRV